ncbi:MAG: NAD(P)-dependent oxidoreductase [Actinomycetota bacterium]|nr:NAD(P)-dependent oxidoreductase [Actinomycetota bacterium]
MRRVPFAPPDSRSAMTVVVTGAAGFIGGHLVRALAGRGYRVAGIDRRAGVPTAAAVAVVADLSEPDDAADTLLGGAEAVFHLAARSGVRNTAAHAEASRRRNNVEATRRVLGTVPLGVPLVVTSSSTVYGGSRGGACAETDRLHPIGGYARSKVDVERLCARRVSHGGLLAVARPFTVAGEGQRPDMAVARWLADARAGRPLCILGSPSRTRDLTDVRDVVEGLIRMAERGVRSTINLGTGRAHKLAAIAADVCDAVGVDPGRVVRPAEAHEVSATLADTRRCAHLLDFVPTTDLGALLRRQAAGEPAAADSDPADPEAAEQTRRRNAIGMRQS